MRLLIAIAIGVVAAPPAEAWAKPPVKKAPQPVKKPVPKPEPPAPAPANKVRADALFEDGRRYLTAKEFALACTAFEQSHQAEAAIGTQLNIALCYEQWGKIASAYRAYLEAERLATAEKDDRAKGARQKIDALAPQVPHVMLEVPPGADASAVYLFDSKELAKERLSDDLLVDPGTHEIEARVPGRPSKKTAIDIKLGERRRIAIDVPAPEPPVIIAPRRKGRLYAGIGMVSGGVAAIGIASFVALVARQDYADAIASCPDNVCTTRTDYDATQSARRRATYMTFVGAGGVLLVGAGVYLIVTSRGQPIERRAALVPLIAPDAVGVALGGRL